MRLSMLPSMLSKGLLAALVLSPVLAFSQTPELGTLRVTITPKEAKAGDTVVFAAGKWSASVCRYLSTHAVEKTSSAAPDSFLVTVDTELEARRCDITPGYAGPTVKIHAEKAGHYTVRFDTTSVFKADMGDTAVFTAVTPSAIRKSLPESAKRADADQRRIDGKLLGKDPRRPARSPSPSFPSRSSR